MNLLFVLRNILEYCSRLDLLLDLPYLESYITQLEYVLTKF